MTESIWDQPEFAPLAAPWFARQQELQRRAKYYDGSIFKAALDRAAWLGPRLYRGVKPLYLALHRAVDIDAGIIPGDWPLHPDIAAALGPARDQVLAWSNWAVDGVLYVHWGALYGVSVLKVIDVRGDDPCVQIAPVNPLCALLISGDPYREEPTQAIVVEERTDADGTYEYAEVIDAATIRTFKNGQPHAYAPDAGRAAEYPNQLGYVPFVEVRHKEVGTPLGECTYQHAIPLFNEVNQIASYAADVVGKNAEPQWVVIGAAATDLERNPDKVWFLPAGADVKPIVPELDIPGVLEFLREIRDQLFAATPELAFDELKSKTQIATATLELQLLELVIKIKRCRPNYDGGLAQALRMAGRAARLLGLTDLAQLDTPALRLDDQRPVLPLDRETLLKLEGMELDNEQKRRQAIAPQPTSQPSADQPAAPQGD